MILGLLNSFTKYLVPSFFKCFTSNFRSYSISSYFSLIWLFQHHMKVASCVSTLWHRWYCKHNAARMALVILLLFCVTISADPDYMIFHPRPPHLDCYHNNFPECLPCTGYHDIHLICTFSFAKHHCCHRGCSPSWSEFGADSDEKSIWSSKVAYPSDKWSSMKFSMSGLWQTVPCYKTAYLSLEYRTGLTRNQHRACNSLQNQTRTPFSAPLSNVQWSICWGLEPMPGFQKMLKILEFCCFWCRASYVEHPRL